MIRMGMVVAVEGMGIVVEVVGVGEVGMDWICI